MRKLIKLDSCHGCKYYAMGNKLAIAADGRRMNTGQAYCLNVGAPALIDIDILIDKFPDWCPLESERGDK